VGGAFLAKIAVTLEQAVAGRAVTGTAAKRPASRMLARGEGWSASDLICTFGPTDRRFEEQHSQVLVAVVLAGSFQYRTPDHARAGELMTPGSLLLGNAGQCFECGHEHGTGDRCLSFSYAPEYFEVIAPQAGAERAFRTPRVPYLRALSPLVAQMCARLAADSGPTHDLTSGMSWEELSIQLAALAARLANGARRNGRDAMPSAVARESELTVRRLAREAGLSPYHFLRCFEQLTGVTPHQYLLRTRLRKAATRLATEPAKVLDIALDCGFGDVSNFNRAFRREFGTRPQVFRQQGVRGHSLAGGSPPGVSGLPCSSSEGDTARLLRKAIPRAKPIPVCHITKSA
jgi:AraC family transcriptional regulator